MIKKLTSQEYEQAVKSPKLSIIDFSATWCGPCQMLAPTIEKLSDEISDADFYSVDIDEQRELAIAKGIEVVPTVLFVKNGQEQTKSVGYKDYEQIKALIEQYI